MASITPSTNSPVARPRLAFPTATPASGPSHVYGPDAVQLSTSATKVDPGFDATGLTAEEIGLVKQRLLPANFSAIKQVWQTQGKEAAIQFVRGGKQGPFNPAYGDPQVMLDAARRTARNPELLKLAQSLKKGDIIVITWNNPNDFIGSFTKGPFSHALVCVDDGPPPDFIEAVGMSGPSNSPGSNVVRRTSWESLSWDSVTSRVLSPADQLPEPARSQAIANAVRFTVNQLGKPYNYSFTDTETGDKPTDSYYCSELAYLAYASPEGANLNLPISKSADRDQLMVATEALVDALKPENKREMMDRVCKEINQSPRPTEGELTEFFINQVMVECLTTKKIAASPRDRAKLEATIEKILQGKAFPDYSKAMADYRAAKARGDYNKPFIGGLKAAAQDAVIDASFTRDATALVAGSGADLFQATGSLTQLTTTLLPYSETILSYLYGPKDSRTRTVGQVLDDLYWVKSHAPHLPIVGSFGLDKLPTRAKPTTKKDFVSPTDLGWADLPHRDFNVKPSHPLDPPAQK